VRGTFTTYSGTFELDPSDFTKSKISGEIDVASIDSKNADRDNHLRTDEFLDVANHPKITFTSTGIEAKGDAYVVHGELTLRGVTKPVALDVEFAGATKNPYGQTIIGVSATGAINRREFGVQYNALLEAGGVAVSDKVKIEIDVQARAGA
jgi:polyisoprenoid-binding protein YceI